MGPAPRLKPGRPATPGTLAVGRTTGARIFTGIVEEVGRVERVDLHRTGGAVRSARLVLAARAVLADVGVGDSIAVNGCCLTVATLQHDDDGVPRAFAADLIAETLDRTGLGDLAVGDPVNLERAMATGDRFGGHLVQGHVDGVGEVLARVEEPGTTWLTVSVPEGLGRYLVPKGSVTLDGTSLTVVDLVDVAGRPALRVGLVPHTLAVTVHGARAVGDRVNVEVDVVAKYVERMLEAGVRTPYAASAGEHR